MKLSIIVPIYKVEDYIVRCMEGILHQDLDDYEVIAVDDGSPDRSVEVLQTYLDAHPTEAARVRIIRKENGGLSDARNAGLTVATGEYVWFVDSDDTIAENCLGRLYEMALTDDLDLMLFDEQNLEQRNGQLIEHAEEYRSCKISSTVQSGIDLFIELRSKRLYYGCAQGYWLRRENLSRNGLAFYKGIHHEDELFTPQAMHYAARARYIGEHPYIRYIREGSITQSENINRRIIGYGTVITQILTFGDQIVRREDERHWIQEDMVSLAQIILGDASRHRDLSEEAVHMLRQVRQALTARGLHLGITTELYILRNKVQTFLNSIS